MQTIQPIRMEESSRSTRQLLETVNGENGGLSNMVKTMAQSPIVLQGYLQLRRALAGSKLSPKLRAQIALTVAQANRCEYSQAQHTSLAREFGMTNEEIQAILEGRFNDAKTGAVLRFARELVTQNGQPSTSDLRQYGYDDSDVVEIVAYIALNWFESAFNNVAQTEVDSPKSGLKANAA